MCSVLKRPSGRRPLFYQIILSRSRWRRYGERSFLNSKAVGGWSLNRRLCLRPPRTAFLSGARWVVERAVVMGSPSSSLL
jgi:hypothetical protein